MKERVVDTKYDPLIWLGTKIPRRTAIAASRSLSTGDTSAAESQARDRLRDKPSDVAALRTLARSLTAQGRFDDAAEVTGTWVQHTGRGRTSRLDALAAHVWALLCAVESDQLPLDRVEDEIAATLQQAQRAASTGTVLSGAHALHHLVHGRLAEAVEHAREAIAWDRDPYTRADDLVTLAEALAGLGETEQSASAMQEAEQLWSGNPRLAGVRSNLEEMNVATP
jgi:Flp pilus assembly protein TadD